MNKTITAAGAPAAVGPYSQAVCAGGLMFLSGQIPLDPATGKLAEGDVAAQTAQACKNVLALLKDKKRKAEWEAKQAQKKLREQQELDRLAAMSDDDVMQASMNRVSQDTERLTRRNMKLCVMEDVQTECLADPAFARLVMNPKKKMLNCFHYINRKAREYLEQEMKDNDEKPMGGGFGGDVPDELCYQWAREYFRDAEAKEDAEPEEKFVPKTYNGKMPKAGKVKKDKPKKAAPKPAPKPANEEQLTFGDFGTEEAAG